MIGKDFQTRQGNEESYGDHGSMETVTEAYRQEVIDFLSQYDITDGQEDNCPGDDTFAVERTKGSLLDTNCPFFKEQLFQVSSVSKKNQCEQFIQLSILSQGAPGR